MFSFTPRQVLSSDIFEQLSELLRETIAVGSMAKPSETPQQEAKALSVEVQHSQSGVTLFSHRQRSSTPLAYVVTSPDVVAALNIGERSPDSIAQNIRSKASMPLTWQTLRFTLVASPEFKALLIGQMMPDQSSNSHRSTSVQDSRSVWPSSEQVAYNLLFDPEAIATFTCCLLEQIDAKTSVYSHLTQILEIAQQNTPNDPTVQSRFTLELMGFQQSSQPQTDSEFASEPVAIEEGLTHRTQILHDAMLAAQAADQAKTEFLAAMSHELRTPLTYILGMSSTLLRWSSTDNQEAQNSSIRERQHRYLQNIHNQGEHLLELINEILDLSQLESGKMSLDLHDCSLSLIAQQTLKTYADKAKEKRIRLELSLDVPSEFDHFKADPRRLRQLLLNLLSNAVKFTPESGKVTLRVASTPSSVTFQIKDTGIGIPDHLRTDIFQKFRQLDSSYRRQYEGTGLGLALTKQLVDLHGGQIECESTVNVGTVFTVTLPRTPFVRSRHEQSPTSEPNTQPLGRIVLIESQDEVAHLVSDMLTAAGYQLIWMLEGWSAVAQVEMLQPSMVLVGTCLPDVDSCELIQQIRQNPSTKQLKILALGSASTPYATEYFLQAGIDEFLNYPMGPEDLLHAVSLLMTMTATARQN
ncbi:MAG: hybrid sensor histidine kinase/response regulator [Elainellaceae cyanobacterium]